MDLATLIGLLGSLGIVVSAIVLGASAMIFLNGPSLLIVVGGSLFVVLSKFTLQQFLGAFKVAAKALKIICLPPHPVTISAGS